MSLMHSLKAFNYAWVNKKVSTYFLIWWWKLYLAVNTPWSQQCRVKYVNSVGSHDYLIKMNQKYRN